MVCHDKFQEFIADLSPWAREEFIRLILPLDCGSRLTSEAVKNYNTGIEYAKNYARTRLEDIRFRVLKEKAEDRHAG